MTTRHVEGFKDLAALKAGMVASGASEMPAHTNAMANQAAFASSVRLPKKDAYGRSYATGKRKEAICRVWLKPGSGRVVVNDRELAVYFARPISRMILMQPLVASQRETQYDAICTVKGGGLSGQAGAIRHGISKALVDMEPELHGLIKGLGFLTRDSRVVERKKYGRRKARRRFQFSKR